MPVQHRRAALEHGARSRRSALYSDGPADLAFREPPDRTLQAKPGNLRTRRAGDGNRAGADRLLRRSSGEHRGGAETWLARLRDRAGAGPDDTSAAASARAWPARVKQ